ncbi:hypothetical protein DV515_00006365, partial [Chloebia gouldiae]
RATASAPGKGGGGNGGGVAPPAGLGAQHSAAHSPPVRAELRQCRALGAAGGSAGPRGGHRPGSAVRSCAGAETGRGSPVETLSLREQGGVPCPSTNIPVLGDDSLSHAEEKKRSDVKDNRKAFSTPCASRTPAELPQGWK